MMNPHIKEAIKILGGQVALAKACNVSQPAVSKWLRGGDMEPENALAIELATNGAVTRKQLLPKSWHKLWPELRGAAA